MGKELETVISVRLPQSLLDEYQALCRDRESTVSQEVRKMMKTAIKNAKRKRGDGGAAPHD